jgi:hypothetical protein
MDVQLLARYEVKYAVHPGMLDGLRRALRFYCSIDRTGVCAEDGLYTIDSLYFDTPSDRFFLDGEEGMAERMKLRTRTYPDTPGSIVKIEVKRRAHDLISKTSTVVPPEDWAGWLAPGRDLSEMPEASRRALQTFLALRDRFRAAPKMLVRYRRIAFHGRFDDYVRITLDMHIECQPMRRLELRGDERRWQPIDDPGSLGSAGHLLMEVKFQRRPPVWVVDLVRRFGLRRQGFSKYCSAVRRALTDRQAFQDRVPAAQWEAVPVWIS